MYHFPETQMYQCLVESQTQLRNKVWLKAFSLYVGFLSGFNCKVVNHWQHCYWWDW
jgi:hypothetical protein